jgi:tetratricopeptide (TPR) repeat protein
MLTRVLLLAVIGCCWRMMAQQAPPREGPWHHPPSPFRAVYQVKTPPNVVKAGYFLSVPVCGLGDADGQGVHVFDQRGRALRVRALGPGPDHTALVQAAQDDAAEQLFAYWGGPRRAPQNDTLPPGLTITFRELPARPDLTGWNRLRLLFERAPVLGVLPLDKLEFTGNPFSLAPGGLVEVSGALRVEQPQEWQLFLVHPDAAFGWVGENLVFDHAGRGGVGRYRRGEGRQTVRLPAGATPLRLVAATLEEPPLLVLARYQGDRQKGALPAEAFVQPGRTTMGRVESQHAQQPCPAFRGRQVSYLSLDETTYTLVELSSLTGQPLTWQVGGGAGLQGAMVATVQVGLAPLPVEARAPGQREAASGSVGFATVPDQVSWTTAGVWRRYADVMLLQELPALPTPALLAYLEFLTLHEREPGAVPVAQALLAPRPARQLAAPAKVWLALARGAAAAQPALAAEAYPEALRHTQEPDVIWEYLEFALYRQADYALAAKVLDQAARTLGPRDRQVLRFRGELALLQGQMEAAAECFRQVQAAQQEREQFRQAAVQANALLERVRRQLREDAPLGAERDLREVAALAPELFATGHYALLRTQLLLRLGWPAGALTLLDRTLQYNPLPAFLPDLELQRALTLRGLQREEDARQVLQRITQQYPNHPAAATARKLLAP